MLNFNKTTEYSFRIMSYIASDVSRQYKSDDIYKDLKIPFRYLRRLLTKLSNAGLLESIQGKYGGFKLTRKIEDITLYDILVATDENSNATSCFFGFPECPAQGNCLLHEAWTEMRNNLNKVLKNTTLAALKDSDTGKFILTNSLSQLSGELEE